MSKEEIKFRPMPIYVTCKANVTIIGEKWTIYLTFPKLLYNAIMAKEENGKKVFNAESTTVILRAVKEDET